MTGTCTGSWGELAEELKELELGQGKGNQAYNTFPGQKFAVNVVIKEEEYNVNSSY